MEHEQKKDITAPPFGCFPEPIYQSLSESSLIIYFGDQINECVVNRVQQARQLIEQCCHHLLLDVIPSYTSIHLTYDVLQTEYDWFQPQLARLLNDAFIDEPCTTPIRIKTQGVLASDEVTLEAPLVVEVPIYYGEEVAFDLPAVAAHSGLSEEEVIKVHSEMEYTVYTIGFSPGFAFLGNIDERIAMPRMQTPRTHVPAGSLGIANRQTAVYPVAVPGGWRIIGRTPMNLVDYSLPELSPFQVGGKVRFKPIDKAAFLSLGGQLDKVGSHS